MKILQICGQNLASLAGDFCLDFESGPLAETGLFAISGPTGAGKSTLLDALSLALYDRTSRMGSNSGYQIPDGVNGSLGVHDPRNLLRRGTAAGFAEVKFVGNDGRHYCARWSVRRAHGKAAGRLQASDIQLRDASGNFLGGTKTEVLAATECAIGLTFDQFRRSILLAQGDFAAFLKAKSDERSELLERMTGTELYSAVSKRAYAKAKEIEGALRLQEEAAKALLILDTDARAALQASVVSLDQTVASTASRLGVLREQKIWWLKDLELRQKLDQARARLAAAQKQWTEVTPRREVLADIERVQSLRAVDKEATRTADEFDAVEKHLKAAESDLARAKAEDERAALALAQASQYHAKCRTEAGSTKPQIDIAKSLDQAIVEKTRAVEVTDKKLAEVNNRLVELQKDARTLDESHESISLILEKLTGWMEANGAVVVLANGWRDGVAPQLQAFERTHACWKVKLAALDSLQRTHEQAVAAQTQRQQALTAAEMAATAAQELVRTVEAAEMAHPAGDLAERRMALHALRIQIVKLQQQHEMVAQANKESQDRQIEAEKVKKEIADADTNARQAAVARHEVERQLAGTERMLVQLGLDVHRAQLINGEPCPLCGSTDHPGTGPIETTVAVLEALKRQQIERAAELQKQETSETARTEARADRLLELTKEVHRWQAELGAAVAGWNSLGGTGDAQSVESKGWLDAKEFDWNAQAKAVAEQDHALAQLRHAAAEARKSHGEATACVETARGVLKEAESTLTSAVDKRNGATAEVATLRQILDATLANLAHAFGEIDGWQVALEDDPKTFTMNWTVQIEQARQNTQDYEINRKKLADNDVRRNVQASDWKQVTLQREALDAERKQQASDQNLLQAKRQGVLQGRPAIEVETILQATLNTSEQSHTAASEQAKRTREDAAKKEEAHRIAEQALTKATLTKNLAEKAFAEALAITGLDTTTLRTRLAHEEQWISKERAALNVIDRLYSSETLAVEEREKDLAAHEGGLAPAEPLADIEASIVDLEPRHGEQTQQLGAAKQQLEQDNQNRAAGDAKAEELAQARNEAKVWQQLDLLIGSADGNKFRKFAQSMTMELLLAQANAELVSLAPRYVLQRVKTQDLDLQVVDRDMGDEIRSTSSLSGGETFLVSLALALGLSSLASEKVRIESLFIDEGFGSLDPKTLETALATLDSLQSVGRKVGLISHVAGLAERIGVQVLVERQGQGASSVRVIAGAM